MNWDAIGAIAELLGAIGVIASLVYLAREMRHNTRATQAAAFQQFDQTLHDAYSHTLTVPGMARVGRMGLADYEQLNEDDAYLFRSWVGAVLMRIDNGYYQYRSGMLDEASWQMLNRMLAGLVLNPGCTQWWHAAPHGFFSAEFVALVDRILTDQGRPGPKAQA